MIGLSRGLMFASAVALAQRGMHVARESWGEKGSAWIELSGGSALVKRSGDDSAEWSPTQDDMFANDWYGFEPAE